MMVPTNPHTYTSSAWTGDRTKDRVIINVGGTRHECYLSTIQNFPDTRLYWIAETALKMADFDPEANEFFFDRHPGCFQNILNYCRTGKLHCPNDVCGPLFEAELAFWGVEELMMEPCCWGSYTQHRNANKNLKMFGQLNGSDEEYDEYGQEEQEERRRKMMGEKEGYQIKIKNLRQATWDLMEKPFSSKKAQINALISIGVILLSLTTFCLQTMSQFSHIKTFEVLEICYCVFFTAEFVIRLLCCPSLKKFFKSVMTWIDIISTLQFYISFSSSTEVFQFLFVSRMIRIFRLFRFFKRLSGMQVIVQTLKASANELFLLSLIVFIPMVIFSTLMYYAEREKNSKHFANIPETFWWAIITMTTVGYGDVHPKSNFGKVIGSMCACSGVLIVALPVSVIGSNFSLYYSYAQARMKLPKRKSPALVSADKALFHGGQDKEDGITGTLRGILSVTVDMVGAETPPEAKISNETDIELELEEGQVSSRKRRGAIQPSHNPISKKTKDKRKKISTASNAFRALSISNLFKDKDPSDVPPKIITAEGCLTEQHSRNLNLDNLLPVQKQKFSSSERNTSLLSLSDNENKLKASNPPHSDLSDLSFEDNAENISLGHACSTVKTRHSPKGGSRRILHVNLDEYVPRKLSSSEQKARKKLNFNTRPASRKRSQSDIDYPVSVRLKDGDRYGHDLLTEEYKINSANVLRSSSFGDRATCDESQEMQVLLEQDKKRHSLLTKPS